MQYGVIHDGPSGREVAGDFHLDAKRHFQISGRVADVLERIGRGGTPVAFVDSYVERAPLVGGKPVTQTHLQPVVGIGVVEEVVRTAYLEIGSYRALEGEVFVDGSLVDGAQAHGKEGKVAVVHAQFGPHVSESVFLAESAHYRVPHVDAGYDLMQQRIFHLGGSFEQGRVDKFETGHRVDHHGVAVGVDSGDKAR